MHTEPHYESSLQKNLEKIREKVLKMANLDEAALRGAMDALLQKNRQLAYVVILRDQLIDDLEDEIDSLCLQFITRHQPMAGHLRFVYAVLKMVNSLERIGDYAESMARQVILLYDISTEIDFAPFQELADQSIPMFRNAIQAFLNRDVDKAAGLMEIEEVADQLRYKINNQIFELRSQGALTNDAINPLLTIARRLERVADQAKNICQETLYVVTGENVRHSGCGKFHILFVDDHNSLVSQMAEGIGNAMDNPKFRFSSAGVKPLPLHPMTVAFMAEKGINISESKPKTIAEVLQKEAIHAVILLSAGIRISQPHLPVNTMVLEWPVKMPKMDVKNPGALFPEYERVFTYLSEHIQDLVQAVSGQNL
jgi:phosphate transport system protein